MDNISLPKIGTEHFSTWTLHQPWQILHPQLPSSPDILLSSKVRLVFPSKMASINQSMVLLAFYNSRNKYVKSSMQIAVLEHSGVFAIAEGHVATLNLSYRYYTHGIVSNTMLLVFTSVLYYVTLFFL